MFNCTVYTYGPYNDLYVQFKTNITSQVYIGFLFGDDPECKVPLPSDHDGWKWFGIVIGVLAAVLVVVVIIGVIAAVVVSKRRSYSQI